MVNALLYTFEFHNHRHHHHRRRGRRRGGRRCHHHHHHHTIEFGAMCGLVLAI